MKLLALLLCSLLPGCATYERTVDSRDVAVFASGENDGTIGLKYGVKYDHSLSK